MTVVFIAGFYCTESNIDFKEPWGLKVYALYFWGC